MGLRETIPAVGHQRFLTGLIGAPIAHSASPAMHAQAADALGVRCHYQLIEVDGADTAELRALEQRLGPSLYTSMHWVWTECLRLLALTGWQLSTDPANGNQVLKLQEDSLLRLGGTLQAA